MDSAKARGGAHAAQQPTANQAWPWSSQARQTDSSPTCAAAAVLSLGNLLGLRPLDRVQLNDLREIRDMQLAPQLGYGNLELPFLFFQRVLADGRLELRSPGGYRTHATPADVCDVIPGTVLKVRAIPRRAFLARLALPYNEIGKPPGEECYASASVLYVEKDRWGRVDRTFVWFDDGELNDAEAPWPAPIHPDDRAAVASQARRTCMPVVTAKGGASYSASHGTAASVSNAAYAAGRFFAAALEGSDDLVSALAGIGACKSATPASVNRLLYKLEE